MYSMLAHRVVRRVDRHRELHDLRRLHVRDAERNPAARAVHALAECGSARSPAAAARSTKSQGANFSHAAIGTWNDDQRATTEPMTTNISWRDEEDRSACSARTSAMSGIAIEAPYTITRPSASSATTTQTQRAIEVEHARRLPRSTLIHSRTGIASARRGGRAPPALRRRLGARRRPAPGVRATTEGRRRARSCACSFRPRSRRLHRAAEHLGAMARNCGTCRGSRKPG